MKEARVIPRLELLVLVGYVAFVPARAADLDFEGLPAGTIVNEMSQGAGISGDLKGAVEVFGFNPRFGPLTNAAVVYDSSCTGGCSGQDDDLGTPNSDFGGPGIDADGDPTTGGNMGSLHENALQLFNQLIVAEDLVDGDGDGLVDDPDDADLKDQYLEFDFSNVRGGGTVKVNSVTYVDNDAGEFNAHIEMFGPKIADQFISMPPVGDNGVSTLSGIGVEGVRVMRVVLDGSGAVANVVVEADEPRPCWVTLGGFQNAGVTSGPKQCTFGGNVGPPPSGALEVNFHSGPFAGSKFHTNGISAVECLDMGSTGPQQPGGKNGLEVDTLVFDCTGRLNNEDGYTCSGFFKDAGEPQGKNGNDHDRIEFEVRDVEDNVVAECVGDLDGGNIQIHPPVGRL